MKKITLLITSALILGFVFGYNDNQPIFELSVWFLNFLNYVVIGFVSLAVFMNIPKLFTGKYGCTAEYDLWTAKRFDFRGYLKFPLRRLIYPLNKIQSLPLGIMLPIIITLLSNGSLFFIATMVFITTINPAYRIGKKFVRLTEYENAKLSLISPVTAIIIAILSKLILPDFPEISLVNSMLAISCMLPVSKLNGSTIFYGSRLLYIFASLFILVTAVLLNFIEPIAAAVIAVIFAVIITIYSMIKAYK